METYDNIILKRIGYILFLIVLALHIFNVGGGNAESANVDNASRKTVTFGAYDQDNNPDNGQEPVEWIVLEEKDGKCLLLSKCGLDAVSYQDNEGDTDWEKSTLRAWLNKDFLESAFTPLERLKIVPNKLKNLRNRKFYTQGGPDTMDRVHVPGVEEIERYLPEQAQRAGKGWWWLRCPGSNLFSTVAVYDDGSIYENGIHIDYEGGGVRPAVWVLLKV